MIFTFRHCRWCCSFYMHFSLSQCSLFGKHSFLISIFEFINTSEFATSSMRQNLRNFLKQMSAKSLKVTRRQKNQNDIKFKNSRNFVCKNCKFVSESWEKLLKPRKILIPIVPKDWSFLWFEKFHFVNLLSIFFVLAELKKTVTKP